MSVLGRTLARYVELNFFFAEDAKLETIRTGEDLVIVFCHAPDLSWVIFTIFPKSFVLAQCHK